MLFIKFIFILLTHSLKHTSPLFSSATLCLENIRIQKSTINPFTQLVYEVYAYIETQYILLMGSDRFIYEIFILLYSKSSPLPI